MSDNTKDVFQRNQEIARDILDALKLGDEDPARSMTAVKYDLAGVVVHFARDNAVTNSSDARLLFDYYVKKINLRPKNEQAYDRKNFYEHFTNIFNPDIPTQSIRSVYDLGVEFGFFDKSPEEASEFIFWCSAKKDYDLLEFFLDLTNSEGVQGALHDLCEMGKKDFITYICTPQLIESADSLGVLVKTQKPARGYIDDGCFDSAAATGKGTMTDFLLKNSPDFLLNEENDSGMAGAFFCDNTGHLTALFENEHCSDERVIREGSYALLNQNISKDLSQTEIGTIPSDYIKNHQCFVVLLEEIKKRNLFSELSVSILEHSMSEGFYLQVSSKEVTDEDLLLRKGSVFEVCYSYLSDFLPKDIPAEWALFPKIKTQIERDYINQNMISQNMKDSESISKQLTGGRKI